MELYTFGRPMNLAYKLYNESPVLDCLIGGSLSVELTDCFVKTLICCRKRDGKKEEEENTCKKEEFVSCREVLLMSTYKS